MPHCLLVFELVLVACVKKPNKTYGVYIYLSYPVCAMFFHCLRVQSIYVYCFCECECVCLTALKSI